MQQILIVVLLSFTCAHASLEYDGNHCLGTLSHHDGRKRLQIVQSEACSTNRAFGYAIGRQFHEEIAARILLLGPQLQKAIVRVLAQFSNLLLSCKMLLSLRKLDSLELPFLNIRYQALL